MPSTFKHLKCNVDSNSLNDNIYLYSRACSDQQGQLVFTNFGLISSSLNTQFDMRSSPHNVVSTDITVEASTIDEIVQLSSLERVDLIKIDAESSEINVINVSLKTLRRFKPSIVVDISSKTPSLR